MSEKKELKVGDRVAVYELGVRYVATITETLETGLLWVRQDAHEKTLVVHPKQCRKLRPRQKAREIAGEWSEEHIPEISYSVGCREIPIPQAKLVFIPDNPKGIATGRATLKEVKPK